MPSPQSELLEKIKQYASAKPSEGLELRPTPNHHVKIALRHLNKRKDILITKTHSLNKEIESINEAISRLEI